MDDLDCPVPQHFLFGTVRVHVRCRDSQRPLEGVLVRVADSHEAALGQQCGFHMTVTGRDGWAEVEVPFGFVVASVGHLLQEGWVGVDQVEEFCFVAGRRDVQLVGAP